MLSDLPWLLLPPFAFIFMIAPCLSLSLPASPSYYLPVHPALRQSADRIHYIRLLFKTTGMVEGSCSRNRSSVLVHFFLGACHFTILPFPTLLSERRGLIGITSVLFRPDFFFFAFENININSFFFFFAEFMYFKASYQTLGTTMTFNNQGNERCILWSIQVRFPQMFCPFTSTATPRLWKAFNVSGWYLSL